MIRSLLDCQHPQGSISTQEQYDYLQCKEEHRAYMLSDEIDQSYPAMKV